jgi:hypothetical protein
LRSRTGPTVGSILSAMQASVAFIDSHPVGPFEEPSSNSSAPFDKLRAS